MTNFLEHLSEHKYAIFISASLEENSESENDELNERLVMLIRAANLEYYYVNGCYNGKEEQSFAVLCNTYSEVARLETLGLHDFKQESVLVIDFWDEAAILKFGDKVVNIGSGLERASSSLPHFSDNYSIIDGVKYVVRS